MSVKALRHHEHEAHFAGRRRCERRGTYLGSVGGEPSGEQGHGREVGEVALDYLYRRGKFETRDGGHPIVVLLEFKMAKIDGLEVLKTIKADENLTLLGGGRTTA
jgi:hypothetical protein